MGVVKVTCGCGEGDRDEFEENGGCEVSKGGVMERVCRVRREVLSV